MKMINSLVMRSVVVRSGIFTLLVSAFCLTQLSGCGVMRRVGPSSYDGPPDVDVDINKIHDAVPRVEPYHPYGTKDYVLNGKRYKVLKTSKGYVKKGYASWYGSKFHGNHTSTQEKYNLYSMTAASPELPLPSYVEVTNLRNGKKVVVRVNDRGPFYPNRILDLSYAAAKKLGFASDGVAPVKIVAIDPKSWNKGSQKDNQAGIFLQLGAFSERNNAEELSARLHELVSESVKIIYKSNLYRVQIGPFASAVLADKHRELLESKGFSDILTLER